MTQAELCYGRRTHVLEEAVSALEERVECSGRLMV